MTSLNTLLYRLNSVELFGNKHLFYAVKLDVFQGLIIDEPVFYLNIKFDS